MLEEDNDDWTMSSSVGEEDNGGLSDDSFDVIALAQRVNRDLVLAELEYTFMFDKNDRRDNDSKENNNDNDN